MAKIPAAGATKTRLIGRLGADGAAALSAAMAEDVMHQIDAIGLPWRVVYSGPPNHPWLIGRPASPQRGADLGERLSNALIGGGLAVGTDCLLLDGAVLKWAHEEAAAGLVDLRLGLALDGGYTFVAVTARAVAAGVFQGVPWSTSRTAQAQLTRARQLGLVVDAVDGTFDIDEEADLTRLETRLAELPAGVAPHTRGALEHLRHRPFARPEPA